VVITPSHNPPRDGGIKYNPPHGGPADTDDHRWIESRANALLAAELQGVKRLPSPPPWRATTTHARFVTPYVDDLGTSRHGGHPQGRPQDRRRPAGRRGVAYWKPIAERYGLNLEVVNPRSIRPSPS
jgi:phosphoglucomutase